MTGFDLDTALRRLGDAPAPARLATLEAGVFARLDEERTASAGAAPLRIGAIAVAGALALGATSTSLTPANVAPQPMWDTATTLAPSTLLGDMLG